jgi:hypothetical protein
VSLSPQQLEARAGKVTASFVPYLMAGKEDRIREEWMKLAGHPDYAPADFSTNWPVQFGSFIETFALDWHQAKASKALTRRGEVVVHPDLPHVCCTLDAYRAEDRCVIDCKALGSYRKIDEACSFYLPQIVVQRACVGALAGSLLIVHGGSEPVEYPLEWGADYEALVWERIGAFWQSVLDLSPPVSMPLVEPPVPAIREVDMNGNNAWADSAFAWLEHRDAAKQFASADKALKALVPGDAKRCFGHEIEIKRSKSGALTIKEMFS